MFCENCGQPMDEGSSFCGSCGNKIEPEENANQTQASETSENYNEPDVADYQTQASMATDRFCENCGQPMDEGSSFCESCGHENAPEGRAKPKISARTIIIAALAIIVVVGGIFAWRIMSGDKQSTPAPPVMATVPGVTGMTQVQAETNIKEEGLTVGTITNENHDSVPAGSVISQSLPAGTSVEQGTAVDMQVSTGTANVIVMNVIDMALVEAEAAITEAGLVVGTKTEENHRTVPKDSVISQSLPVGISVARGTAVDLRVSSGRDIRPVDSGGGGSGVGSAPPPVATNPPKPPAVKPSGPTPEEIAAQLKAIEDARAAAKAQPVSPQTPPTQKTTPVATSPKPASQVVSVNLTAGTPINVITSSTISTEKSQTGEGFEAVLDEDVMYDGRVVARRGSIVKGVISESDPGGRIRGVASISLRLTELTLADGRKVSITTNNHITEASSSVGKDVAKTGIGAGIGAAIGAIAGGGRGAAIGAAIGGAGGTAAALATRGDPAVIAPETRITFNLTLPLNVLLK